MLELEKLYLEALAGAAAAAGYDCAVHKVAQGAGSMYLIPHGAGTRADCAVLFRFGADRVSFSIAFRDETAAPISTERQYIEGIDELARDLNRALTARQLPAPAPARPARPVSAVRR